MATQVWKFLVNTFYVQTAGTMKKALMLTQDHVAKLTANEADAEILAIKTDYLPLHTAFVTTHTQLESKLGIYKGQTQTFEEMLEELSNEQINVWRGVVFNVFPEGTPDATAIFPKNREPFQSGAYELRVDAVEALSLTLATYTGQPTLVTLSATVHAYYLTLSGARALQQTDEGSVDTLRVILKAAHQVMCDGMYRNLGLLMAKYYQTPLTVANYYDLTLIRETGEEESFIFNGPIAGNTILNLNSTIEAPDLNLTPDSRLIMRNPSPAGVPISYYKGNSATSPPGGGPVFTLEPGNSLEITLSELGPASLTFFNIQNTTAEEGNWEIEIIP